MDVAILKKDVDISQSMFLLDQQRNKHNFSIYSISQTPSMYFYGISIFSIKEIDYFTGDFIVCCDYESCLYALNSNINKKIIFYSFDLDWTRHNDFEYKQFEKVYRNKSISVFARSNYHCDIINKTWNINSKVVEDFNITEIINKL